jgi:hypothetical protein
MPDPRGPNRHAAEGTIAAGDWRKSRVAPKYEHWYWVQPKQDPEAFLALVDLINREGEPGQFGKSRYRYLTVGEFVYWVTRSFYDRDAVLINRRRADHDQGDGATFAEDWNEGLS